MTALVPLLGEDMTYRHNLLQWLRRLCVGQLALPQLSFSVDKNLGGNGGV